MAKRMFILLVLMSAGSLAFAQSADMLATKAKVWGAKPEPGAFGFEKEKMTGASPGDFLVNDDFPGTGSQSDPAIAGAPSGDFVIAWVDHRDSSYDIYAQSYDSAGTPLGSNFKVNDDAGLAGQLYPAISMDKSGNFIITWADDRNGNYDIYARRYTSSGTPIGSNFKVNDDTGDAPQYRPAVAISGSGNFVIVWEDWWRDHNCREDIYAQRYDSAGSPMGSNFKVNDNVNNAFQHSPSIAMDGSGNFVITWTDERNDNYDIYAQRYDSSGTASGANFRVNDDSDASGQYDPTIATDGSGNFVVTWEDTRNGNLDIYAQGYDFTGAALGSNFKVNDDAGTAWQGFPAIAMNSSGNFVITWDDGRNGNGETGDIYAQRYSSLGMPLDSNFKVNDDTGTYAQEYPGVAVDDSGNFVIAWQDYRNHSVYRDIYTQRYNSSGISMETNFMVNDDAGDTDQEQPAVATNDLDQFVITWHDYRNDNSDIYAQRYDSSGNTLGGNFKINDDAGAANQLFADVGMDFSGNFVIVWQDYRNDDWDVYAQRFNSSGDPLGVNFKVNDDAGTTKQESPAIAAESSGDFIIAWEDYRNGDCDIYAERYDASGTPLGSNFKVNDDAGAFEQCSPAISSDGSGNFVITWQDYRDGNYDIYAQRYDPLGIALGSNFKVNDDAGISDQGRPAVASHACGSFMITWQDYRNENFDIYAQRYDASGAPLGSNFKVNDDAGTADQKYAAVASEVSGNLVITWQDYRNENWDVYQQRYDSFGNALGLNFSISDFNFYSFAQITPTVAIGSSKICFAWTNDRRAKGWDVYARLVKIVSGLRGDVNGNGEINLADVVYLINYLLWAGPAPTPELLVGDANCDDGVSIVDVVYLINYLFKSGPPPC